MFRKLSLLTLVAFLAVTFVGCEDNSDENERKEFAEEIERNVDREIDRAEESLENLRERIEDKIDERLTEEEIEEIGREIEETVESSLSRLGRTLERIGDRMQEDSEVEVVDYRKFKDLLPDQMGGMMRVDMDGKNANALGMRFSKIEASYVSKQNEMEMEIAILDLGTMQGLATMGFDWIDRKVDKEDVDGFERTTKFGGYPGFESAQYKDDRTETQGVAIIENRFVVAANISGTNLDKQVLDAVFDQFSFRKLSRLAN
ncbi:MAG: hypothetical protein HOC28_04485 [Bacteroidetes Order II. Incertae sedis bacterium]|jgi:hypothetical protein|nr:hypothetical protein [Bacteroidetes Order II. bacterium]MDG1754002.1 hypothetical protein [Rhodothermales bacterium]HAY36420.1 hypothetical protein [Bacteroidota bacterium]MBT4052793.1 hypothetical protein [Bacteroidetes Order II. bacterium]MBT4602371.1 hypothetical protein [Bacteroidetes Order II. bacterium]